MAVAIVIVMAAVGVTFNVPGEVGQNRRRLRRRGRQNLPAGVPISAIVAQLRASGQANLADMLEKMNVVPGQGILFDNLFNWLLLAVGLYAIGSVLMWANGWILNGVVQKTVYEMRREVATKLERLPLSYFDKVQRGAAQPRHQRHRQRVAEPQQTLSSC